MCQGGDSGARVRIKAGYFAGREGTLVDSEGGNDPARMRVRFDTGFKVFFNLADLEFLPTFTPAHPWKSGDRARVGRGIYQGSIAYLRNRTRDGGWLCRIGGDVIAIHESILTPASEHPELREPPEEPPRDLPAVLAGIGRWQQQDPMKRRVHFTAEPVETSPIRSMYLQWLASGKIQWAPPQPTTYGSLQGHVVTVHVAIPPDTEPRSIRFTTPLSAAEVVEALDHLVSQPAGTRARATTPEAEALATHADRTPAYYGPAEGIS